MKLTVGISPCPNDTFIFEPIFSERIKTTPYELEFIMRDVEELNAMALKNEVDIIKISYAHYPRVISDYIMLRSGGAMGKGVGPLLVAKNKFPLVELNGKSIALPGEHTTAHFLFSTLFPEATQKTFMLFSDIGDAVVSQQVDAGVLIHEGRFTYEEKGLQLLVDLGVLWQERKNLPLPLGGIAMKRSLHEHHHALNRLLHDSVLYSFRHNNQTLPAFVIEHAQEMSEDVMKQHIQLYVNDFSLDVGSEGQRAVQEMFSLITTSPFPIFVS